MRTSTLFNVSACSEALPQIDKEVALLLDVAFTEKRSNSPCGFLSVVERDAWEHVVDDVVLNDTVEDVATNEAKVAVDCGSSALDESPVVGLVVRRLLVCVVKVGDGDDPVVHPEVRQTVCQESGRCADAPRGEINRAHGQDESNVAQRDEWCLGRSENGGSRVQMTLLVPGLGSTVALGQALRSGTGVHQDVSGPAKHLVEDKSTDLNKWCVGSGVVHDLLHNSRLGGPGGDFGLSVGDENSVLLHVVVVAVMTCVAELPAKEWHHQDAVEEPASHGVDGKVVGKGIMTTVVGENPEAGKEAPLYETVQGPKGNGDKGRSVQLREPDGRVEESAHDDEIANNVREGADHGALEALCRNSIFQGLDVWNWSRLDIVGHSSEPSLDRRCLCAGRSCNHGPKR